ncbi:recombinase family protein [Gordonia liuliyuniae]|uniref:Recombinase family protein n=1 Tax=Gordonia liuliyuniae TaxID=2911517 RepID=A0ABS9IPZ5_9ACTN|nr:recombinase family protein [Gordonia liuliyuniae]MCF8587607.1 recombinase family protein [Gordonia liuliyuniae]
MSLYLVPHQARKFEPTPYERKLAGAIEEVFGDGGHTLEALIEGLNENGFHGPDGKPWSQDSFTAEMARMGEQ